MKTLIRIGEVVLAVLLAPLLSPWIYRSAWFSDVANGSITDVMIRLFHAQAYENQTLVVDLLALGFAFLSLLVVILLVHMIVLNLNGHKT